MSKETLGIVLAVIVGVLGFAIWLADKAEKTTPVLTIGVLAIIFGLCLCGVYLIPWVWNGGSSVEKIWRISSVTLIVLVGVVRFGIWIWPSPKASTPNALFQTQLSELEQLENFIGTKNESQLQELFGFPKLLSTNLWIERSGRAPDKYTPEEMKAIDAYIRANVKQVDTRFGVTSRDGNVPKFTANKGAVAVITLPPEYVANRATLSRFESSIKLPSAVLSALRELDQVITNNTSLLFDVMNEKVNQTPENLIFDNDPHSRFYCAITNTYWERFTPLRPKTEKVNEAARTYLKVE